jgi:hypothetical protein
LDACRFDPGQGDFKGLEKAKDKLETELMYSRAASASFHMNGDAGEEDGVEDASVYKVWYFPPLFCHTSFQFLFLNLLFCQ